MALQAKDPTLDLKRLQRCLNDLISLLALPAVWSSREPAEIVQILIDALMRMLTLDFIYARLEGISPEIPMDFLRVADSCQLRVSPGAWSHNSSQGSPESCRW